MPDLDPARQVALLVGTTVGAFVVSSDPERRTWRTRGPLLPEWHVYDLMALPGTGRLLAATNRTAGSPPVAVVGATTGRSASEAVVQASDDLGVTWRCLPGSPRYPPGGPRGVREVWRFGEPGSAPGSRLYAGVADAGLFTSVDEGESWTLVTGLDSHPTRPFWDIPATAGCLHSIVVHPADPRRIWVGVAGAGVFGSDDGGLTWEPRNTGLPPAPPDHPCPAVGRHVHKLALDPRPPYPLYLQHRGSVSVSTDGGRSWQPVAGSLPGAFGFPLVVDRRGTLYVAPLAGPGQRTMPGGRLALYRSADGGASWTECRTGLPETPRHVSVLRDSISVDDRDPVGVYFGTTSGELFASPDGGDNWLQVPGDFTRITSLRARVLDDRAHPVA